MFLFLDLGLSSVLGQTKEPAPIFRPALEKIQRQTRLPIMLPPKLPSVFREKDRGGAGGEVTEDGYSVWLYFASSEPLPGFAAGFGGSTRIFGPQDLPNTRQVKLSNGRTGLFRPVMCGGSCAPPNLWWEQNGVMYQIQIKLRSNMAESDQERILVETANSTVTVQRR